MTAEFAANFEVGLALVTAHDEQDEFWDITVNCTGRIIISRRARQ
jgi:hypothetical protein